MALLYNKIEKMFFSVLLLALQNIIVHFKVLYLERIFFTFIRNEL